MTSPRSGSERQATIINAFSIDVEDYFQVQGYADVIPRAAWDTMPTRVERNTDLLLRLLEAKRARGTFFVLGWVARRHPALVRRIAAEGHEVACHGMSHTMIYEQSPDVFRNETRESKALLEDLAEAPVVGYRAATFSITDRSLWALEVLAEEGFRYDSSIFPIRHDRYGIVHAPRLPYHIDLGARGRLVEFPPSTLSAWGHNLPVAGGGYFRLLPLWLTSFAISRVNARDRSPFVFYLHPWEIDPDQPRVPTRWTSTLRHRLNLGRSMDRLRHLLERFTFGAMRELLAAQPPQSVVSLERLARPGRG
jgi:polysaccharide deacetylase family protein (PEP-CTERM system associated)